ncbi:Glu/Leu/Phe/Val family dehydrogenase [Aeromicrobium fastidiosum]|uniref:Glu/Leu/Phe/Val family dehydrogenase n=1 Tax=Aeromicrobium fastidiosum TaxID=52699 RepID=UPI001CB75B97|nr:Glu/Leu/Phe/Val dehydrogenase dimerization domain-containing protein [Aeromicrobium fastidiosum]
MADRRTGMRGVLVIDNTSRGMGKGGTRMGPHVSVGEISRLARSMTWKWAAVDLFFGGAKAGIVGDPRGHDKEAMLRSFARALSNEVPAEYVFGLDMGLTEADAAILADEIGGRDAAVGLPSALGGLPYDELGITGFGVAEVVDAATDHLGIELKGGRVAIEGFGAVGQAAAQRLVELGAVIVAVSTVHGAVHDPNGLAVDELVHASAEAGDDFVKHVGRPLLATGALAQVEADVLVPAAREDTIDEAMAHRITARLVVEGANMPTTSGARAVLRRRGITVIPDFIANAGGAVAAAHAMDMRHSAFVVDPTSVLETVSAKLRTNAAHVLRHAHDHDGDPREVALALARSRVREAMLQRGHVPRPDWGVGTR